MQYHLPHQALPLGVWSIPINNSFADGNYIANVTATDVAGNVSSPVAVEFIVDTVPPVVTAPSGIDIVENTANGAPVAQITATDGLTNIAGYDITAGNEDGAFSIDNTGLVTVADSSKLDYESGVTNYNLTVAATDAAGNVGTTSININVSNVEEGGGIIIADPINNNDIGAINNNNTTTINSSSGTTTSTNNDITNINNSVISNPSETFVFKSSDLGGTTDINNFTVGAGGDILKFENVFNGLIAKDSYTTDDLNGYLTATYNEGVGTAITIDSNGPSDNGMVHTIVLQGVETDLVQLLANNQINIVQL